MKKLDFSARLLVVIIICIAVSEVLRIWLSSPVAYGLGFFVVPLASYSLLHEVRLRIIWWILCCVLFGAINFMLMSGFSVR
jgi:hypothetical protein